MPKFVDEKTSCGVLGWWNSEVNIESPRKTVMYVDSRKPNNLDKTNFNKISNDSQ